MTRSSAGCPRPIGSPPASPSCTVVRSLRIQDFPPARRTPLMPVLSVSPKAAMQPFDQEPLPARPREQALTPARLAATAAAALPAVSVGLLCFSQGISEISRPSVDCAFHLMLGAALLVLFADVALVIKRSSKLSSVLLAGVLGFAGAFAAAVLAEFGGPPVLGVIVLASAAWALVIVRRLPAARH